MMANGSLSRAVTSDSDRPSRRVRRGRPFGSAHAAPTTIARVTETAADIIAAYAESEGLTKVRAAHLLIVAGWESITHHPATPSAATVPRR